MVATDTRKNMKTRVTMHSSPRGCMICSNDDVAMERIARVATKQGYALEKVQLPFQDETCVRLQGATLAQCNRIANQAIPFEARDIERFKFGEDEQYVQIRDDDYMLIVWA